MDTITAITADQARAARALVQVSPAYLGSDAGMEGARVRDFEYGHIDLDEEENARLRKALEDLGAVFIDEDEQGGHGVRLKFNSGKVRVLERWENEGGPAYEDDV